jgi:hypothetical protein
MRQPNPHQSSRKSQFPPLSTRQFHGYQAQQLKIELIYFVPDLVVMFYINILRGSELPDFAFYAQCDYPFSLTCFFLAEVEFSGFGVSHESFLGGGWGWEGAA